MNQKCSYPLAITSDVKNFAARVNVGWKDRVIP